MEFVSMKCPSCGALIYFENNQDRCFCSHCGSQIQISDPNSQKYTYTTIDSARIKEAETRERIRQRELDLEEQRINLERRNSQIKASIIAFVIIAIIAGVIYIFHLAQINYAFRKKLLEVLSTIAMFIILIVIMIGDHFLGRK